jgi:hypothetical protein
VVVGDGLALRFFGADFVTFSYFATPSCASTFVTAGALLLATLADRLSDML